VHLQVSIVFSISSIHLIHTLCAPPVHSAFTGIEYIYINISLADKLQPQYLWIVSPCPKWVDQRHLSKVETAEATVVVGDVTNGKDSSSSKDSRGSHY
jgi:hypothetical protein